MATFFHRLIIVVTGVPFRLWTRLKVEGRHNLPKDSGYIIGFNHPGLVDPVHIAVAHWRPLYGLGREEEFDKRFTGFILGRIMRMLPLSRTGGDNSESMQEAVRRLRRGEPFFIAPEGARSDFGPLGRGRTGIARLALEAGVPMVPTALFRGKGVRCRVVFGEPMDTTPWHGMQDDHRVVREVTDRFMSRIARLLGEPYHADVAPDNRVHLGLVPPP